MNVIGRDAYWIIQQCMLYPAIWWFQSMQEYHDNYGGRILLHPFQACALGMEDQVLLEARAFRDRYTDEEYDEMWDRYATLRDEDVYGTKRSDSGS